MRNRYPVNIRTYNRDCVLISLESDLPISNQEGEIEDIFHRLSIIVGIDDEFKDVYGTFFLQYLLDLKQ